MNIFVIGKGGREHAIVHAISKSSKVKRIYAAPGNPGIATLATCVDIADHDIAGLCAFAKEKHIDLTIVGPEHTLSLGVVDAFQREGLRIFGPTKAAAKIESSKDFAKTIMKKYDIPTASYQSFDKKEEAIAYVLQENVPIVIKEDGLKAGKGVSVAYTIEDALEAIDIAFEIPNNRVVIEECLVGFEYSLICFVCDDIVVPMEVAQDHKCVYDGDEGPNTGGMGVYSPVQKITPAIIDETMKTIMEPMASAMVQEGCPFTGFLYGGLMLTDQGIKTIEFNARFGDPEAEVILPRLKSDFVEVIEQIMDHKKSELVWDSNVLLGVVMASEGYPNGSTNDAPINGVEDVDSFVFHMGTCKKDGQLMSNGGRVLCVVARGNILQEAFNKAYNDVRAIQCEKLFYRKDIGKKDME